MTNAMGMVDVAAIAASAAPFSARSNENTHGLEFKGKFANWQKAEREHYWSVREAPT